MVPTMEITRGAFVSGHVDLHLQIDCEHESFVALGDDLLQLRVEIVGLRYGIGPVQRQDGGGNDFRLIAAGIDRVFAGSQRLLPDAAVARADQRAELEIRRRRCPASAIPRRP